AEQVWARRIARLEEHRAVALVRTPSGDAIAGVLMIDVRSGEYLFVQSRAVLLATGGGPTMYRYHTPSGDKSCDGLAMALDAGLDLRDMEMVQFHPTGLLAGAGTRMTGTVLEEGLRGAGGWLLNGAGERFMSSYDPSGERATRDIVSRAIYAQMRAGRTTPNGGVYIVMGHLGADRVRASFKGMVERCADCGFDLAGGQVEVVPTAHYMMGGVRFGVDTRTALPGLFAAGEDTGGVHGANRLGGNGVANSTVFGGIAGETMARWVREEGAWREPDPETLDSAVAACELPFSRPAGKLSELREALYATMWDDAGIVRNRAGLARAASELERIEDALAHAGIDASAREFNLTWHDWMNLRSLARVSRAIVLAAQARENSRGAHYRDDFPDPGAIERSSFTVVSGEGGALRCATEPVEFPIVRPGESLLGQQA
ncbi:MAG: FAD-binding protein, partial [Burkholderiaceae bacterium]|nr:FAD-binding protein [Burkholderiaceae bacterium]